jgi:hypothetical protein
VLKGIHHEARFLSLYVPVVIASPAMLERGEAFCDWAARGFVERVKDKVYIKPIE